MSSQNTINGSHSNYDRANDLKAFDEQKSGVKGVVDAGTKTIPKIFIRAPEDRSKDFNTCKENLKVPVIDLAKVECTRKDEIVQEMLLASQKWGFFQVVNHGIPLELLEKMIEGARMFHEQDVEAKKGFYSREKTKVVSFNTNYDFYTSRAANWRDTLYVNLLFASELEPEELPSICRDVILDYLNHVFKLSDLLLELLSIALGLKPHHLQEMECRKGWYLACHYYPCCPEPDLTLGVSKHTDPAFLTILLQDQLGGLQVLHDNHWVEVEPIPGSLTINIGDLLQVLSNDKFTSVHHRVIAKSVGPRISIPVFITGHFSSPNGYGPIEELVSNETQPVYKKFTLSEFYTYFYTRALDQPTIEHFKV